MFVPVWGWTEGNKALFKEWEEYYRKLVQTSPVVIEEDVTLLLGQQKKAIDDQQTLQNEQERVLAHQAVQPMARPEGATRESHRRDPLAKPASEQS